MRLLFVVFSAVLTGFFSSALAQDAAVKGVPIFETPTFAEGEGFVGALARAGAFDRAEETLEQLIRRYPGAPRLQIARAKLALGQGRPEKALAALAAAQSLGYADIAALLDDAEFQALADDERVKALRDAPQTTMAAVPFAPAAAPDGWAEVTASNVRWDEPLARLWAEFVIPDEQAARRAFVDIRKPEKRPLVELNQLVRQGKAAGNVGDFYDNRDDDHSVPRDVTGTQVTRIKYGDEARSKGLHYGLNEQVLFNGITFGNSSTALTGKGWRSQGRHALTTQLGPLRAWQLYDNNHIYVFPEHHDHDPKSEKVTKKQYGKGDVFPANTPLMLISQGSSGSDKGLLQAIQAILAAFKPDVKALLKERRLIAPTVQQILRRGMAGVENDEDYLSSKAHPTVFDQKNVRLDRMIRLAYGMTADATPPRVRLALQRSESPKGPFASPIDERLFATPDAISYAWRGAGRTRVYALSAAGSFDVNDRPLTYFWRVLRGDPDKIKIQRTSPDAAEVEVTVDWHDRTSSPRGLESSRIDIALFAYNGAEYSAPAFFSLTLPTHQTRVYSDDPLDGRPLSIAYERRSKDVYVDPAIWPERRWTDEFHYTDGGRMSGWTRTYRNGEIATFTEDGLLLKKRLDDEILAEEIRYEIRRPKNRMRMIDVRTGRVFRYKVDHSGKRIGRAKLVKGG